MGDRTTVTLTVLEEQAIEAANLFKNFGQLDEEYVQDNLKSFVFLEVNYGNLPFLHKLINAGIAFDSEWNNGGNYCAGIHFVRFDSEGLIHSNEVTDESYNPDLDELVKRIDDYDELKKYILDHKRNVIPLPWDNQVEYGKIHRALMLIKPKE
jgi:hypothetical protein